MVFRVAYVERFSVQSDSLWVIELGFRKRSVKISDRSGADDIDHSAFERGHNDAIVIRVADEKAVAAFVGQHFARKTQKTGRRERLFEAELQWLLIELTLCAEVCFYLADDAI